MRSKVFALLAVWCALISVLAVTPWVTAQGQASGASKSPVAVLDVQAVFDQLDERTQIQANLQTQKEELRQEAEDRRQQVNQLQQDLSILQPGSDQYKQKQRQAQLKAIELKAWMEFQNRRVESENALQLERLYRDVVQAAGRVAEENGFELVLLREEVDFENLKPKQVGAKIYNRKVVWAKSGLDISDLVIQRMNTEFNAAPR